MKLESTLPEAPPLLYAAPVLNVFCLLLVFFLLGPSFVNQPGVSVEPPVTHFWVERQQHSIVVTVHDGNPPLLWLERDPVTMPQLRQALEERRHSENSPSATVLLLVDRMTPAKVQQEVAEIALLQGYQVILLGSPQQDETPGEGD